MRHVLFDLIALDFEKRWGHGVGGVSHSAHTLCLKKYRR